MNNVLKDIFSDILVSYVVVYKNKKFLKDAIRSVKSLNDHVPNIHSILYTDFDLEDIPCLSFNEIKVIPSPSRYDRLNDIWSTKYQCMLSSIAKYNLILDADTFICGDISDLFLLLDKFDMALPMSIHHISAHLPEVPSCFPEFGGGVILWKASDKTRNLFSQILQLVKNPNRRGCDEPYLRKAVYESDIRFAVIPWEYNCTYLHPGYLFSDVKIIHGRYADLKSAAELINMPIKPGKPAPKRVTGGGRLILFEPFGHRKYKIYKEVFF